RSDYRPSADNLIATESFGPPRIARRDSDCSSRRLREPSCQRSSAESAFCRLLPSIGSLWPCYREEVQRSQRRPVMKKLFPPLGEDLRNLSTQSKPIRLEDDRLA